MIHFFALSSDIFMPIIQDQMFDVSLHENGRGSVSTVCHSSKCNIDRVFLVHVCVHALSGLLFCGLQVSVIQKKLKQWSDDVLQMENLLSINAKDILTE